MDKEVGSAKLMSCSIISMGAGNELIDAAPGSDVHPVELVRFLDLAASSRHPLSPSLPVDVVWHEVLEKPALYEGFCLQRYGRVLVHVPGQDLKMSLKSYELTRRLMTKRFGPIDHSAWPADAPAACSVRAPKGLAGGHGI